MISTFAFLFSNSRETTKGLLSSLRPYTRRIWYEAIDSRSSAAQTIRLASGLSRIESTYSMVWEIYDSPSALNFALLPSRREVVMHLTNGVFSANTVSAPGWCRAHRKAGSGAEALCIEREREVGSLVKRNCTVVTKNKKNDRMSLEVVLVSGFAVNSQKQKNIKIVDCEPESGVIHLLGLE